MPEVIFSCSIIEAGRQSCQRGPGSTAMQTVEKMHQIGQKN
jgi:hypothetical protein